MNTPHCIIHSFQGICGEPCPWCRLERIESSARLVVENFALYGSQINVVVPMDLIERLQIALTENVTTHNPQQ